MFFILSILVLLVGIYFNFGKRSRNKIRKVLISLMTFPFRVIFK